MNLLSDNTHDLILLDMLLFILINVFLIDNQSLSASGLLVNESFLNQVSCEAVICCLKVVGLLLLVADLTN